MRKKTDKGVNRCKLRYDLGIGTFSQRIENDMINMLRAIMERVDNMQKQVGDRFKEMGTVSNNQNDMV